MDQYKKLLHEYVSFKSISTDKKFLPEMTKTVKWLSNLLQKNGFKVQLLQGPKTNPIVFAEYVVDPKLETVLIYGHYDVQPAKKADGWTGEPFSLTEKGGRLIARGVVDNKGQNLIHIVTAIQLIKEKKLGYNLKFLIEGNEETANPDMAGLIKKYKSLLKSDHIIISDGEIVKDIPTIEASLRGGFNMTVLLKTGSTNLHSGLCGGGVPSASHEMAVLINKLFSKTNKIAIPGFYAGVDKVTKAQVENNRVISTDKELAKLFGVKTIITGDGCDFHTQTGLFPTMQVSGVKTGYIEEGYCNIVPCEAEIRINVRLVASQKPAQIFDAIKKFIEKNIPDYVDHKIVHDGFSEPIKINIDSEIARKAKKILRDVYKREPIIKYVGGGIPIVTDFKKVLGIDSTLISFGNDDCHMHGVNENFKIDLIKKGLEFSRRFLIK
jgi:acetylornithine deacetylase/succinyl-diaminopimelate desuccinylase-like protein